MSPFMLEQGFVGFYYEIPIGKFRGQKIVVAFDAPQFPNVAPSGPYIKPFLFPFQAGGQPPSGGIHNWHKPDSTFQYWSRPFPNWTETGRDMKTYLAFLRTLFDIEDEKI